MSLTITTPIDTISGILTDTIAAKTQALYNLAREDWIVISVADDGGNAQIVLSDAHADITANFPDGSILFFSGDGVYDADTYAVLSTTTGAGSTKITVDLTFSATDTGFVNEFTSKPNYRVDVELFDDSDLMLDRTISFGLPQNGVEDIDIKSTLIDYMTINELQYVLYSAEFTEVWDGSSESPTVTADLLAILGNKQILKTGGALMYEYLCDTGTPGKHLTRFETPIRWLGWRRRYSYIHDPGLAAREAADTLIKTNTKVADINRVIGASIGSASLPFTEIGIKSPGINTANTSAFLALETTAEASSSSTVLDTIFFETRDECLQPIMVEWLSSLGAYEQHLFSINQDFVNEGGESENVNSPVIGNIDVFKGGKSRITGPTFQTLTMSSERMTRNQMRALSEIKNSEVVRVYLSKDGTKYVNTRVIGNTGTPFNSRYDVHTFTLELEFPDGFDFFEGKTY